MQQVQRDTVVAKIGCERGLVDDGPSGVTVGEEHYRVAVDMRQIEGRQVIEAYSW